MKFSLLKTYQEALKRKKRTRKLSIKTHNGVKVLSKKIAKILYGVFPNPIVNCNFRLLMTFYCWNCLFQPTTLN